MRPVQVGDVFRSAIGQRLVVTRLVDGVIEFTNRERQTRRFYTPNDLQHMIVGQWLVLEGSAP